MPKLTRPDITLHYEVVGEGPPLMLLAGLASDGASWLPVSEALASRFQLILPDNRATGQTRPLDAPTSIDIMAADALALLDHLGLERVHLLGHSMGGIIAARLAAMAPARVKKLVIAASHLAPSPRNGALMDDLATLREAGIDERLWYRQLFYWLFAPSFFEDTGALDMAINAALAYPHAQGPRDFRRQVDLLKEPIALDLSAITARVLLLCAEEDLLFRPAESAASFAGVRDLTTRTIAGAGHSLHWDKPDDFVAAVTGFLLAE